MSESSTMTILGSRGATRSRAAARRPARGAARPARSGRSSEPRPGKGQASLGQRARDAARGASERLGGLGRWRVPLIALAVAAVVALALYEPARGLYSAWRTQGIREAQLEQLNESNEEYRSDIDRLQSREGIEEEARKRGYVTEGETSVIVEGLPEDDSSSADDAAENPWYIGLLDTIFRYEEG